MMGKLNLEDLPAEAVEKLKELSFFDFELLAVQANRIRDEERQAALPSEPLEAARGAGKALNASASLAVDEPLHVAHAFTSILKMALSYGEANDLDRRESQQLWCLADMAERLLSSVTKNEREASSRLRAATHPVKE